MRGGTYQCPGYKHHGRYGIEIWRKEIHHDLHRQSCKSQQCAIQEGNIIGKTSFITTRFGNVLGSNGSVIPLFRQQIMEGGPVTVTHPDIIRYFMTIPEACRLVLEAAFMGQGNDIFIFDMGKPVKITDMACRMIKLAGLQPDKDIEIVYTGLRPGEKLYEELLYNEENSTPTLNPKIFKGISLKQDYDKIKPALQQLVEVAQTDNKKETVYQLKQIVPEFKSMNSVYEALDEKTYISKKMKSFHCVYDAISNLGYGICTRSGSRCSCQTGYKGDLLLDRPCKRGQTALKQV